MKKSDKKKATEVVMKSLKEIFGDDIAVSGSTAVLSADTFIKGLPKLDTIVKRRDKQIHDKMQYLTGELSTIVDACSRMLAMISDPDFLANPIHIDEDEGSDYQDYTGQYPEQEDDDCCTDRCKRHCKRSSDGRFCR